MQLFFCFFCCVLLRLGWLGTGGCHICHYPLTWLTLRFLPCPTHWTLLEPLLSNSRPSTKVVVRLGLHYSLSQTPSSPVQVMAGLGLHPRFFQMFPSPAQVAAGLSLHHNFSEESPSTAQGAIDLSSLCNLSQVVPSPTRVANCLSLYQSSTQAALQSTHPMGSHGRHQNPAKKIPAPWVQPPHVILPIIVMVGLQNQSA